MSRVTLWLNHIDRSFQTVGRICQVFSALSIFALVVVVGMGVVFRYFLNAPLQFVDDMCALLYMALTFLAMAYVFVEKAHIRITFLFDRLPEGCRRYLELAGCLATLLFLFLLIRESWGFFSTTYELHGTTDTASIPLAPWLFLIPLSLTILSANILVFTLKKIRMLFDPNDPEGRKK